MRAWPDLTEYHEAVQHPQNAFADPGSSDRPSSDSIRVCRMQTTGVPPCVRPNQPGGVIIH